MHSLFLIVFLFCLTFLFPGTKTNQTPSGIDYVARGYNIFYGSPKSTKGGDPGFRSSVFLIDSSKGRQNVAGINVPQGVQYFPRKTCSTSFSSEVVDSSESLQKSLDRDSSYETSVSASFSYDGAFMSGSASFSARWAGSESFSSRSSKMEKAHSTYIISEATCTAYEAIMQRVNHPPYHPEFEATVKNLPATYDEQKYFSFLTVFGTHVFLGGLFGSKYGKVYELSRESVDSLKAEGSSLSRSSSYAASASMSGFGASGSASFGHDSASSNAESMESAKSFAKSVESTESYSIGARPPANGDVNTWAASSDLEALPIKYQLEPIHNIVAQISQDKAKHVVRAYAEYAKLAAIDAPNDGSVLQSCYMARTYRSSEKSAARSLISQCETAQGYRLLGGGHFNLRNAKPLGDITSRNALNWIFPGENEKFVCGSGNLDTDVASPQSTLGECSALCCRTKQSVKFITVTQDKPYEDHVTANNLRRASLRADCPRGTTLVSGGFFQKRILPDSFVEVHNNNPVHDPKTGLSGWKAHFAWTHHPNDNWVYPEFVVYARCARTEGKPLKANFRMVKRENSVEVKGNTRCHKGEVATGVGWEITNRPQTINDKRVVHVASSLAEFHSTTGPVAGRHYFRGLGGFKPSVNAWVVCLEGAIEDFEEAVEEGPEEECENVYIPAREKTVTRCPNGFLTKSISKGKGFDFHNSLLYMQCCRKKGYIQKMECNNKDTRNIFTPRTWSQTSGGFYVSGLSTFGCPNIDCLHGFHQCKAEAGSEVHGQCYTQPVHFTEDPGFAGCKAGFRIAGIYNKGTSNNLLSIGAIRCCEEDGQSASAEQQQVKESIEKNIPIEKVAPHNSLDVLSHDAKTVSKTFNLKPKNSNNFGVVFELDGNAQVDLGLLTNDQTSGYVFQVDADNHYHMRLQYLHRAPFDSYHGRFEKYAFHYTEKRLVPGTKRFYWMKFQQGWIYVGSGDKIGQATVKAFIDPIFFEKSLQTGFQYKEKRDVQLTDIVVGVRNGMVNAKAYLHEQPATLDQCTEFSGWFWPMRKVPIPVPDLFVDTTKKNRILTMNVHSPHQGFDVGFGDLGFSHKYTLSLARHNNDHSAVYTDSSIWRPIVPYKMTGEWDKFYYGFEGDQMVAGHFDAVDRNKKIEDRRWTYSHYANNVNRIYIENLWWWGDNTWAHFSLCLKQW